MVGGASHEGGGPSDLVAHLEPDATDEEALRSFGIGRANDDVTQFAGADRFFAEDAWCTSVLSVRTAGPVVRLHHDRILGDPGEDLDRDACATVMLEGADTGRVPLDGDTQPSEPL